MIKLLTNCNNIQKSQACCHTDGRICCCYNCLRDGFYAGIDSYSCLKKLCYYVMNYGPAYVSEIYHFLGASRLLENNFHNSINVLSLGCGFGPDFIALQKYIYDNNLSTDVKYFGYDQEQNWLNITHGIINNLPIIANILNGFTLKNRNIIFLNKFFSTLLKNGTARKFLDKFIPEIKNVMSAGSVIVFNDVNHYKLGRDVFDSEVGKVAAIEGKYFFNIESAYSNNFTEIPWIQNICNIPDGLPISPKNSVTKSVFYVYKKIS